MKIKTLVALVSFSLFAAAHAQHVTVNAVTYLHENASVIWRTITSPEMPVALDWPNGATHAVLTSKIGARPEQSARIDDTSATSCRVVFVLPTMSADREVVTLSISYRDASGGELKFQNVRLGLVDGIGNGASVATALAESAKWRRCEKHAVVQIPPDAARVSLDGVPVDCDIPGWYDLAVTKEHALMVETSEGICSATVFKAVDGFVVIFR
jgi:hypothetical protein